MSKFAYANGERRNVCFAFLHHIEMRIEGRRLENFGKGKLHLIRKRREVRGGNLLVGVLNQMQVLDQQVPPAWPVAKQQFISCDAVGSTWRPLGFILARLRPSPGCSNARI